MTPATLRGEVVLNRADWVREMLRRIRSLPLESWEEFSSDYRNAGTAESCMRRALEALLDLGRHLLAKGFGEAAGEYREIPERLVRLGVLTPVDGDLLRKLAGYRNRMVHFYHEVGERELFELCSERAGDVQVALDALMDWVRSHPEKIDRSI